MQKVPNAPTQTRTVPKTPVSVFLKQLLLVIRVDKQRLQLFVLQFIHMHERKYLSLHSFSLTIATELLTDQFCHLLHDEFPV